MDYKQIAYDILFNHKEISFSTKSQFREHSGKINKEIKNIVMSLSTNELISLVNELANKTISPTMSERQTGILVSKFIVDDDKLGIKKARLVEHKTTSEITELIPEPLKKFIPHTFVGTYLASVNKELSKEVVEEIANRQSWESRKDRYGDKGHKQENNYTLSEETKRRKKERFEQTNIERYGVPYPAQNKEIRDKQRATTKKRYGSELLFDTAYFDNKKKKFYASVGETTSYNKSYKAKLAMVTWNNTDKTLVQSKEQALNTLFDRDNLIKFMDDNFPNGVKRSDLADALGLAATSTNRYIRKYNIEDKLLHTREGFENEVYEYITTLIDADIQRHIHPKFMNGKELDIYIPTYRIAVECNGEFFHSDYFSNKTITYHKNKMMATRKNNINLIMIWEMDWNDPVKQNIIKSQIAYKLHSNTIKHVYARNLTIKNVDNNNYKRFMNDSHLQGHVGASVKLGLFDKNNTLCAVMSFGKTDRFHNQEYELKRYASAPFTTVVGGVSKLLKHFVKNYSDSILSYTDNDFALPNAVYSKVGFIKIGQTEPGYYWYRNGIKISRQQAQKKRLLSLADKYGLDKLQIDDTEKSYMERNKFNKVFNTGNDIYIYNTK